MILRAASKKNLNNWPGSNPEKAARARRGVAWARRDILEGKWRLLQSPLPESMLGVVTDLAVREESD
jgi:hypothetical protein